MARARTLMKSTAVILVFYGLTIVALIISIANQSRIAEEAEARTVQLQLQSAAIETQAERQRVAFCGILEPFAVATPSTAGGEVLQQSFKKAASAEGIGCTPDSTDGR